MSMMSRDERKDIKRRGRLISSLRYAFNGIEYSIKNEQSVLIQIPIIVVVLVLSFVFKISTIEWVIVLLCIGMMGCSSLINTAIEATVDLVTEEYNPIAKIAKDTSAASVLVFAVISIIIGLIIFIPKFIALF